MNDIARKKLCELVKKKGPPPKGQEPQKVEALLKDICPGMTAEINVLIMAFKEKTVSELEKNHLEKKPKKMILISKHIRQLVEKYSLQEEAARWAVESWALALGFIDAQDVIPKISVPKSRPSPQAPYPYPPQPQPKIGLRGNLKNILSVFLKVFRFSWNWLVYWLNKLKIFHVVMKLLRFIWSILRMKIDFRRIFSVLFAALLFLWKWIVFLFEKIFFLILNVTRLVWNKTIFLARSRPVLFKLLMLFVCFGILISVLYNKQVFKRNKQKPVNLTSGVNEPTETPQENENKDEGRVIYTGSDGTTMVLIQEGYFNMGAPNDVGQEDEHPQHKVWVDSFYIDLCDVTFDQYDRYLEKNGGKKPYDEGWGEGRPVINISWYESKKYCKSLGKRLPTEAEWEKACRGGKDTIYFWGNSDAQADVYAWFDKTSGNMTHPVGEKKPNPYGLFDIVGNVWEWCSDRYAENYYANSIEKNPKGSDKGDMRVLRGDSWDNPADNLRSTDRFAEKADSYYKTFGCRCAMSPRMVISPDDKAEDNEKKRLEAENQRKAQVMADYKRDLLSDQMMVYIPQGNFIMGSNDGYDNEKPSRKVWINAFYMDKYEVTFEQYEMFLRDTKHKNKPFDNGWGEESRPVININWKDSEEYCIWAGKRLPTEMEWEKAARGTDGHEFPWGSEWDRSKANTASFWASTDLKNSDDWTKYFFSIYCKYVDDNKAVWDLKPEYLENGPNFTNSPQTMPVGRKNDVSSYGCFDMAGNVREWCSDWYGEHYDASKPAGPEIGPGKVIKGGSWASFILETKSASRSYLNPEKISMDLGCRCARNAE